MATSKQELRAEISAVLIRYRRRISDRGGVVPDACLDELVAVAGQHAGEPAPRPESQRPTAPATPVPGPGRRQARRQADQA